MTDLTDLGVKAIRDGVAAGTFSAVEVAEAFNAAVAAAALVVAGVGLAIYKYWQPLKAYFSGFFSALSDGLAPIGQAFSAAFEPARPVIAAISSTIGSLVKGFFALIEPISASSEMTRAWGDAGKTAGKIVATAIGWALTPLRAMISLLVQAGAKIEEIKAKAAGGIINWFTGGDAPAVPKGGRSRCARK